MEVTPKLDVALRAHFRAIRPPGALTRATPSQRTPSTMDDVARRSRVIKRKARKAEEVPAAERMMLGPGSRRLQPAPCARLVGEIRAL